MTVDDLKACFEKHSANYLKFEEVLVKRSSRPDLHAFLLLDSLAGNGNRDMVCAAEHDEIFLRPSLEEIAEVATEADVLELVRCGVRISEDSLAMFV